MFIMLRSLHRYATSGHAVRPALAVAAAHTEEGYGYRAASRARGGVRIGRSSRAAATPAAERVSSVRCNFRCRPEHGRGDETVVRHSSASRYRLTRFEGVRGSPSVHDRDCSRRELRPIGSRLRYGVQGVCSHRLCSSRPPRRVSIPGFSYGRVRRSGVPVKASSSG